jgi:hypothetical protein
LNDKRKAEGTNLTTEDTENTEAIGHERRARSETPYLEGGAV